MYPAEQSSPKRKPEHSLRLEEARAAPEQLSGSQPPLVLHHCASVSRASEKLGKALRADNSSAQEHTEHSLHLEAVIDPPNRLQ